MAHELYTRTNQKLFFAGLALNAWQQAEEGRMMNAQALVQAEREAALFHLYGALLGLCHEIAGYYRLAQAAAPRAELLLAPSVLESAPSPELAELVELAQQPSTWLAQLLTAYAALFQPPQAPKTAKVDPTLPLIQSVSLVDEPPALARQELEDWRQQLKSLALRFRESLSEC
ncbi:PasA protein [Pseudomonas sp. UL073]|uniref:PasA protein n=1 Tax=Zestomonas insulae TaxID=2809017 RepID=A0ABS2ICW8_9GAMM|nr:PasA protein [Pseudomonas insulae]